MKGCAYMSLDWNTIQTKYPNMWVALINRTMKDGNIISADVIDACEDDEVFALKDKYRQTNKDRHIWFVRTTESNCQYFANLVNYSCEVV